MDLDDRLLIETPEGLTIELTLAGAGTRIIASALDTILIAVIGVALVIGAGPALGRFDDSSLVLVAFVSFAILVLLIGYPVLFETLSGGRTPGKRVVGIKVVKDDGVAVGVWASLIRNLLRIIDILPSSYVVGLISILVTAKNQRLGDLVAGTVVIRIPKAARAVPDNQPDPATAEHATPEHATPEHGGASLDLAALSERDHAVIARFLERRAGLATDHRNRLAKEIASSVGSKVPGLDWERSPEAALTRIAEIKRRR